MVRQEGTGRAEVQAVRGDDHPGDVEVAAPVSTDKLVYTDKWKIDKVVVWLYSTF